MNPPRILLFLVLTAVGIRAQAQDNATPAPAAEPAQTEMQKWIATTDAQWQAAFNRDVVDVHAAELKKLAGQYGVSLDAALTKATAAGDLDGAVALRNEQKRFAETNVFPEQDLDGEAASVKQIRAATRAQLARIEKENAARTKALHGKYDALLAQAQQQLTQAKRLDDALLVKAKREEVSAAWLAGAPIAAPAVAVAVSPKPAPVTNLGNARIPDATKDRPFVNTLGMKFVPVAGTKVLFSVWVTRVQDYAAYAQGKKVNSEWSTRERDGVPVSREPEYPVVGVSWEDANAFCKWLTEKDTAEGKLAKGANYRLPTDEEWSRAVGLAAEQGATPAEKSGKNSVDFPWGTDFPPKGKVGNYPDSAFHEKFPNARVKRIEGYTDGFATTSPVGSFPANAYGLYDMGGNVFQWCEDWYDGSQKTRVLRGASWAYFTRDFPLSSSRHSDRPMSRGTGHDVGFRCVLGDSSR